MTNFKRTIGALMLTLVTPALISVSAFAAPAPDSALSRQVTSEGEATEMLRLWSPGPRLAGYEMIEKYGAPQEITDDRMIWHNAGPFKRILLTREELPHHFPIVHMDYLEHTISYDVPPDKADDVLAFDGSVSIYRVGGELSARCDLESNNVLTLNLVHEIVEGTKNVEQARIAFGEAVIARTSGQRSAITEALQFEPPAPVVAADTDSVSIQGAPIPADLNAEAAGPDAETLALLIASDMGKVHAAMIARNKRVARSILEYARMMHESHGQQARVTADLGMTSNVTPVTTKTVSALKDKHASALSEIVLLDREAFGRAYMDLMVQAHTDAQKLIDERLAMTRNEQVRSHLTQTREKVTTHLQQARELQGSVTRTGSR